MSYSQPDPRIQKTIEAIQSALATLVAEASLDTITIGDIANKAKINRTTFYRHYPDKYTVLEAILAKTLDDLDREMGPNTTRSLRFNADEVPQPWINFFERIGANADLYLAILHSSAGPWFQARLRKRIDHLLNPEDANPGSASQSLAKKPLPGGSLPPEIASAFSATLFAGVAIWWLEHRKIYDAAHVARWLRQYFLHGYIGSLGSISRSRD